MRGELTAWRTRVTLIVVLSLFLLGVGGPALLCEPRCQRPPGRDVAGGGTGGGLPVRVTVGRLPTVWPGMSAPVPVRIENPNARAARVTTIELSIRSVRPADEADPAVGDPSSKIACAMADFHTEAGVLDTDIAPGGSLVLEKSTIPRTRWPQLEMIDTGVNQDGCQGAALVVVAEVSGLLR